MALSNWDTLAFDLSGKSTNGEFKSRLGVMVGIYKNWLYVYDEPGWDGTQQKYGEQGLQYSRPVVAEIQYGHINYKDVKIDAIRGPQNGIYCVVQSGYSNLGTLQAMVGCGVYGYKDHEFVGVQSGSFEFLKHYMSGHEESWEDYWANEQEIYRLNDMLYLLNEEEAKSQWKYTKRFCKEIAGIDTSQVRRFNQGDAFFVSTDVASTQIGMAKPTILEQAITKMSEQEDKK